MATGLEAVAGVLGIVGVSQQIAQSAWKVKKFCKEVKDAPTELQDLTKSLDTLSRILFRLEEIAMMDPDLVVSTDADILRSSLDGCQHAVERIVSFVTEACRAMSKRKFRGACAFVLKRRELKAMLEKLDSSKIDLNIAATTFYASNARKVTCVQTTVVQNFYDQTFSKCDDGSDGYAHARNITCQRGYLVQDLDHQTNSAGDDELDSYTHKRPSKTMVSCATSTLRVQLPRWVCQKAWDISCQRAAGQWTFSFQSFRVLEELGQARRMCGSGDLEGIRRMLEDRKLSVHDQDVRGYTLYAVRDIFGPQSHKIARTKFGTASSVQRPLRDSKIPPRTWSKVRRGIAGVDTSEFHLKAYRCSRNMGQANRIKLSLDGSPSLLAIWMKRSDASLYRIRSHARLLTNSGLGDQRDCVDALSRMPCSWAAKDWFELFRSMSFAHQPRLFLDLAKNSKIAIAQVAAPPSAKTSVLHILARHLAICIILPDSVHDTPYLDWLHEVTAYAKSGAPLHSYDEHECTPFMAFLGTTSRRVHVSRIHFWAKAIHSAGIDLVAYARVEQIAIARHEEFRSRLEDNGVMGVFFHEAPQLWHLWFRHVGDQYAGQFWDHIEHPERCIPGTWLPEEEKESRAEFWARHPHTYWFGIKRKAIRRLRPQILRSLEVDADAVESWDLLFDLRYRLREYGSLKKRSLERNGSAVPGWLYAHIRYSAIQLGVTCGSKPMDSRKPAEDMLQSHFDDI